MPLLEPFRIVPRNMRDWGRWFATLEVKADQLNDDIVQEINLVDGSVTTVKIADNAVTLPKLADMATNSFMARDTAGVGDPEILSATESRLVLQVNSRVTVTTTTHSAGNEHVILVDDDTAGAPVTISLDAAASRENHIYEIKKLGRTGRVTIDPDAAELIEFSSNLIISSKGHAATIVSDGTAWFIV